MGNIMLFFIWPILGFQVFTCSQLLDRIKKRRKKTHLTCLNWNYFSIYWNWQNILLWPCMAISCLIDNLWLFLIVWSYLACFNYMSWLIYQNYICRLFVCPFSSSAFWMQCNLVENDRFCWWLEKLLGFVADVCT